ncbi:gp436 family protein [Profundibacter sp.]
MAYTTLSKLTERFGERMLVALTDRGAVATGTIDVAVVDSAIAGSDAMIDGYLGGRYSLPLSNTPRLIEELAEDITIWKLHVSEPDPKIEKDYTAAIRTLDRIASGTIRLDVAGVEPAGTGGTGVRITDRERPLTASNLKGFI